MQQVYASDVVKRTSQALLSLRTIMVASAVIMSVVGVIPRCARCHRQAIFCQEQPNSPSLRLGWRLYKLVRAIGTSVLTPHQGPSGLSHLGSQRNRFLPVPAIDSRKHLHCIGKVRSS